MPSIRTPQPVSDQQSHFVTRPRQEDWHLCLPYYKKSGLGVSDVVRQAIQCRQHSKEVAVQLGFVVVMCVCVVHVCVLLCVCVLCMCVCVLCVCS